jgi:hypothetical protein
MLLFKVEAVRGVPLDMGRIYPECPDSDPPEWSVTADVLLRRQEHDEEEDEGEDEDEGDGNGKEKEMTARPPTAIRSERGTWLDLA